MTKIKVFISSVQSEFAMERMELHDYLLSDALLGKFFEPFLFEMLPATDKSVSQMYLHEVEQSSIYIGLFGLNYGFEDIQGISATEREFDHATLHHKTRFVFITDHSSDQRHEKENTFIKKAQSLLVRKCFCSVEELKLSVYTSLINYLIEKEIIRTAPFDASTNIRASIEDIDTEKIKNFVRLAKSKRGFPLPETSTAEAVLTHLNLYSEGKLTNASILLFGKKPQRFFINSEIRCASFYGTNVEKPIPSYKVFKGDVFELVNQAEEFVLSKLDYAIGTRAESTSIPGAYEIPKEIISEAIVNAVAHRDYTSNGSVQVMLFKDRLEIWNPGTLPLGWTTEKLKKLHRSIPANPLLADPMYLAGYIERLGTGTIDILRLANSVGLKEPEFVEDDEFRAIVYRPETKSDLPAPYDTPYDTPHVTTEVERLIKVLQGEMGRTEMQKLLKLTNSKYFRESYLQMAVNYGVIEMTLPDKPQSKSQKYRLTELGKALNKRPENEKSIPVSTKVTTEATMEATMEVTMEVKKVILALIGEMKRAELQKNLQLKNDENFRIHYILPALESGMIEMKYPEIPKHPEQKYRLTELGKQLKNTLEKS